MPSSPKVTGTQEGRCFSAREKGKIPVSHPVEKYNGLGKLNSLRHLRISGGAPKSVQSSTHLISSCCWSCFHVALDCSKVSSLWSFFHRSALQESNHIGLLVGLCAIFRMKYTCRPTESRLGLSAFTQLTGPISHLVTNKPPVDTDQAFGQLRATTSVPHSLFGRWATDRYAESTVGWPTGTISIILLKQHLDLYLFIKNII